MGRTYYRHSTRRFAGVEHEPCVYAAELSTGVVKVGASGSARARMIGLATEVKRNHGAELHRFHVVTKRTLTAAFEAESRLVHRITEVAEPVPGRREFFTGITFEQVAQMLHSDRADEPPRRAQRPPRQRKVNARDPAQRRMYKNNRSGFQGVSFDARRGTYQAQAQVRGQRFRLGSFATAREAYDARLKKLASLRGNEPATNGVH